jgi:hypothetical protein
MRFRNTFAGFALCPIALFYGCKSGNAIGDTCANSSTCASGLACISGKCTKLIPDLDAGTTEDSGTSSTDSGTSTPDSGSSVCTPPTLTPLAANTLACPSAATDTCDTEGHGECCITAGAGVCETDLASPCEADAISWQCQKGADCNVDNTYCCLTPDATGIDTTTCPISGVASASACSHTPCTAVQPRLCASNAECGDAGATCNTVYLSFGASTDGGTIGTLVGVCMP